MAKIKQIKPSDRKKMMYLYPDEKKLSRWDPTWCYPENDEKSMIAAWDCWDINCSNRPTMVSNNNIESSNNLNLSSASRKLSSVGHSPPQASYNQGTLSLPQNVTNFTSSPNIGFSSSTEQGAYPQQSYANVARSSTIGYPTLQEYPQSAVSNNNVGRSSNPPFIENSQISKTETFAQIVNKPAVYTIYDNNLEQGVTGQPKESKPNQTFNAKSRVGVLPKDIFSANYEQTLESAETDQFRVLIKFDEEGNDNMTSIAEDLNSLNLHEKTKVISSSSSKLAEPKEEVCLNFDTSKFRLQENRNTHLINETPNSSKNMMQTEIIKEHNSKSLRGKGQRNREDISLPSQPVGFLIDLDGLDDWLNKTNAPAEDIVSQDLLSFDYNQLGQSWYQTEADKARKNTSSMNDKKVKYEDLLEFDLLMQK